jgi:hypothetical protein
VEFDFLAFVIPVSAVNEFTVTPDYPGVDAKTRNPGESVKGICN